MPSEVSHADEPSATESDSGDRLGDDITLGKLGTGSSIEVDAIPQSVKKEEAEVLKRLVALRDGLPNKLRFNGNTREISLDRLVEDESIQVRPLNNVYVDELERFMSVGMWNWKTTVLTVAVRTGNVAGRSYLKYVVVDGNHRLRAMVQLKLHDLSHQVQKMINCRVYEELTAEECIVLRHSQPLEGGVTLPLTVRDMASIVRRHLIRLGYTFMSTVKLYADGVDAVGILLPQNAPEFVIRMGCSCNALYIECMRLLECFSAGNIKLTPSEMTNIRPIYQFGKTEMFDLDKRSFWHAVLICYNKEPKRVVDIIQEIINNRSSISKAEEELRFCMDPLSDIVVKMGGISRREALERLFGSADIDDAVIQTVLTRDRFRALYRQGSSVTISQLHHVCTSLLAEAVAESKRNASESIYDGMELLAEVPLHERSVEGGNCCSNPGLNSTTRSRCTLDTVSPNPTSSLPDPPPTGPTTDSVTDVDMYETKGTDDDASLKSSTLPSSRKRSCNDAKTSSAPNLRPRRSCRLTERTKRERVQPSRSRESEEVVQEDNEDEQESVHSDTSRAHDRHGGSGDEETHVEGGAWSSSTMLSITPLHQLREAIEKEFICRSHSVIDQFIRNVDKTALTHKRDMACKVATVLGELPSSIAEQLLAELRTLPKTPTAISILSRTLDKCQTPDT